MKTLTSAMQAAIARTDGQGLRHLLQIDPDGTPLYLDCDGRKVGSTQYIGELISVAPIDESIGSSSDTTIEVLDTPANRAAIDLAVDVKLYFWAINTADTDKDLKMWGEISDPIVYAGGVIRFDIISRQSQQWNQSIGDPLLKSDYPGADPDEIGKTLPIIYGTHLDHVCLAIDAGAITTLGGDLSSISTRILATDGSGFAPSGVFQIDYEQIKYDSRTTDLKSGVIFYDITRGHNGTIAVSHDNGATVAQVKTSYDYLIANHPVYAVNKVTVDGVVQSGSDFTILKNENGISIIRFKTRPSFKKSIDIEVSEDISITASQDLHQHTIGTPTYKTVNQTSPYYNKEITYGGMTSRPGFGDVNSYNNRVYFSDALPAGTTGGQTTIELVCGGTVSWEVGYWGGGLFSTWVWDKITSGTGSKNLTIRTTRNDMWIRKISGSSPLYLRTAQRVLEVQETPSMNALSPPIVTVREGGIDLSGNSVAETVIGKVIACDVVGWPDDGSGSITGSANNKIDKQRHVVQHLLKTYGLATDAEVNASDFPTQDLEESVLNIAVKIDDPSTVRDVLKSIEAQTQTIITYTGGRWRMTNRPSSTPDPTPDVTITNAHVKLNEGGSSAMRESRSGLRSLVNKHVYRAGLKSGGIWTLAGVKGSLSSQSTYRVRQKNIELPYLFNNAYQIDRLLTWLAARESNPNRKVISMDVTAALYALEVGDVVRYTSTKHGIDLYFECVAISAKGLTDSTITIEQI
jgi:hypothetical protein